MLDIDQSEDYAHKGAIEHVQEGLCRLGRFSPLLPQYTNDIFEKEKYKF
jgi:hypothetical protein